MPLLRDDTFARKTRGQPAHPAATARRTVGTAVFVLLLVAVALLALSRIEHPLVRQGRLAIADLVAPVLKAAAEPLAPVRRFAQEVSSWATLSEELARLRAENQELKGWEARARELERRLADLGALVRAVDEVKTQLITARVIADASGPFARSVLVNTGRELGAKDGFPVISADGVVGRIVEAGPRAARVLLLTDLNSRIPVLVGEEGVRGILVGDNSPRPKLAHLPADVRLAPGDRVVTSGIGGVFPRGMRIGMVVAIEAGGTARVDLDARLDELDHVSILFHESPVADAAAEARKLPPAAQARQRALARRAGGTQGGEERP